MPTLRALRFANVGHPNARFDDETLRLAAPDGAPTDSTVWLRNGGGKSQILTLFFSMLRPHKRDFLGQTADGSLRHLGDYVLRGDHSVVAAEWALDAPPELDLGIERPSLVTGVFYEYRTDRRAADEVAEDGTRPAPPLPDRLFFAFRATPGPEPLSLATLPLYVDEHRRHRRTQSRLQERAGSAT